MEDIKAKIVITKDGPYLVHGNLPLYKEEAVIDDEDTPVSWRIVGEYEHKETYALCRCGKSQNMPFCDGAHIRTGFKGKETASHERYYKQARKLVGHNLVLYDARELCMGIGFCHRAGSTWLLTRYSDDFRKRQLAIETACDCPAGRLVVADRNTEMPIEPKFEPSVSVIVDPRFRQISPLWVKGGVQIISEDGTLYEVRNRVTLCACGRSHNKPFCDGRHYFA